MIDIQAAIEQLGKTKVFNEFKETVLLADLWKEQTAVLVFVRHFG